MAICTNHLAFVCFFQESLYGGHHLQSVAEAKLLFSANVIKVHNIVWVSHSAIRARYIL